MRTIHPVNTRALEGYLEFRHARSGTISPAICEQIALAVAQTNLCEYSLAEHAHRAAQLGRESPEARAVDSKTDAVLRFARDLAARKGECSVVELRERGWNVFENCLNDVAHTDLDLPKVGRPLKAA